MAGNSNQRGSQWRDFVEQLRDLRGQCALALSDLDMLLDELRRPTETVHDPRRGDDGPTGPTGPTGPAVPRELRGMTEGG